MPLNYSILETIVLPAREFLMPPSLGFSKIYPKDDLYWYQLDGHGTERRFGLDILTSDGLTYSSVLDSGIAPYGAILSLNVGTGMSFSNSQLVVDFIDVNQIQTTNSPVAGDKLTYDETGLNWSKPNISISDIAMLFGIECGIGFTASGTVSYAGGSYSLQIACI